MLRKLIGCSQGCYILHCATASMSKQKKWREVGTDCRGKALLSVSVGKKHSTGQELLAQVAMRCSLTRRGTRHGLILESHKPL